MMEATQEITITPARNSSNYLSIQNGKMRIPTTGALLDGQYRLENGWYLLLVTDNCPFEERLQIILLDQKFTVLDKVELYAKTAPAIIKHTKAKDPHSLIFSFGEEPPMIIQIDLNGFRLKKYSNSIGSRALQSALNKKFIHITYLP